MTAENKSDEELMELFEPELESIHQSPAFPAHPLYHYTDSTGLLGIFKERVLRATHYAYLNDAEELHIGQETANELVQEQVLTHATGSLNRAVLENFQNNHLRRPLTQAVEVFVTSLTEEPNQLSQWRAYAANGAGYALGLASLPLPGPTANPAAAFGLAFSRCIYDRDAFKRELKANWDLVLTALKRATTTHSGARAGRILGQSATNHLMRVTGLMVPRLKHAGFIEEREWRLVAMPMPGRRPEVVKYRPSARGVVPFIEIGIAEKGNPLPLSGLIVGPTHAPRTGLATAKMLLEDHGFDPSKMRVESSRTPYRS